MKNKKITCMGEYKIEKLRDGLYAIDDSDDSSFYVVEGTQRAAVIDTGMGTEDILPVINSVTALPCVLLITHAHGDHMKFAGNFQERYISSRDIPLIPMFVDRMGMSKSLAQISYGELEPGNRIDLGGGVTIEAVAMYGHTPGSLGFYCEKYGAFFSGDAVGSGSGVWMQVPGGLTLTEYEISLKNFVNWFKDRGLSSDLEFLSGHRSQRYGFPGMDRDNPVTLMLVEDMIALIRNLIQGNVIGEENNFIPSFGEEKACVASLGKADIVYLPSKIK